MYDIDWYIIGISIYIYIWKYNLGWYHILISTFQELVISHRSGSHGALVHLAPCIAKIRSIRIHKGHPKMAEFLRFVIYKKNYWPWNLIKTLFVLGVEVFVENKQPFPNNSCSAVWDDIISVGWLRTLHCLCKEWTQE